MQDDRVEVFGGWRLPARVGDGRPRGTEPVQIAGVLGEGDEREFDLRRGDRAAGGVSGQVFTVFIIVLAASEAAIALAIVLQVYRSYHSIMADRLTSMKN